MPETTDSFGPPISDPARPPAHLTLRDHLAPFIGGPLVTAPRVLAGVVVVAAIGIGTVVLWPRPVAPAPELSLPRASTTRPAAAGPITAPTVAELVVHAAGEVRSPGVYRVGAAARVTDVIEAAGGLTDAADRSRLNLASPVADGERVFVPAVGQEVPPVAVGGQPAPTSANGAGAGTASPVPAMVNINTADLAELDTLPGVGPATAQAIVDHRTQNGPFGSVDELLDVRGIGDAKLAEMRDRVAV